MSEKVLRGFASIAFNSLEQLLKHQLRGMMGTPERAVAIALIKRANTADLKIKLARQLLTAIGEDRPEARPHVRHVEDALDAFSKLKNDRNNYVHSLLIVSNNLVDEPPQELNLHAAEEKLPTDEATLDDLLMRCSEVGHNLQASFFRCSEYSINFGSRKVPFKLLVQISAQAYVPARSRNIAALQQVRRAAREPSAKNPTTRRLWGRALSYSEQSRCHN
jgi:hypothetical protein